MTNKWHDITKEQPTEHKQYLCVSKNQSGFNVYDVYMWRSTEDCYRPKHKVWFVNYDSEWGDAEADWVVAWKEIEEYHDQKTTDL